MIVLLAFSCFFLGIFLCLWANEMEIKVLKYKLKTAHETKYTNLKTYILGCENAKLSKRICKQREAIGQQKISIKTLGRTVLKLESLVDSYEQKFSQLATAKYIEEHIADEEVPF